MDRYSSSRSSDLAISPCCARPSFSLHMRLKVQFSAPKDLDLLVVVFQIE